jgi:phosphoribosyl 1,2-cyclic phosphodiesterase
VRSKIQNHESKMIRVCVLASGSKGNAVYVSDGTTSVLVDVGLSAIGVERRLRSRLIDPSSLDGIVVSHEHGDHIGGVGVLSRRYSLPVYINPSTFAAAKSHLGTLHKRVVFDCGVSFLVGDLSFHPFSISHDASDSVGFTIQDGTNKVGIATDLGIATKLVCHHLRGCGLLVLEANHDKRMLEEGPYPWHVKQRVLSRLGHLSNEASRDLLREIFHPGLEQVILAHLSETNNTPEKALAVVQSAVSGNGTTLSVASQNEAGEIVTLGNE